MLFPLSHAITKGQKARTSWISYEALAEVHQYIELDRAASTEGFRWRPPSKLGVPLIVEQPDWEGAFLNGERRSWRKLRPAERLRLVTPEGGSALVGLQSSGKPFVDWATVFRRTSARIRERFEPRFPTVAPHRLRHSMAMATLEWLVTGYYQRAAALAAGSGDDAAMALYLTRNDPMLILRDLLGHQSVPSTELYIARLDVTRIYRDANKDTTGAPDTGASRRSRGRVRRRGGRLMPAYVIDEPLAVHFVFPNGREWTCALDDLPNPGLALDLARGLAANAHPEGGIGAKNTVKTYGVALRKMVRALSEAGFTGTASDLTRATLVRYWMAGTHTAERETRMLLKGFDRVKGALRPEVRAYLLGNQIQAYRSRGSYQAYTDGEWDRLEAGCRAVVDDSWGRHRRAQALAARGAEPSADAEHSPQDIAWLLLRDGPFPDRPGYRAQAQARSARSPQWDLRRAVRQMRSDLFPHPVVQVAYSVLFGMYCGVVPDGIDDLKLDGL
ncbi:hypothetical protein DEJ45_33035 [Streptomyces venezuelae]|uniref:hypothetical protein n=1 Tax=Streptomyces venezuelae TaxID=54571 RepID=UPI00123CC993|nr:hypothetical protein [Streptomyces venezuelae]QES16733.1 hypothetical protein DEJ45_33035 [Streptomyces venezuelae]